MKLLPTCIKFLAPPIVVAACLLLLALTAFGATLGDYKKKVESALAFAVEVETALIDEDMDAALRDDFLSEIRTNFPANEKIEWTGGTAETTNEWLLARANTFDKAEDEAEQLKIVREMREYLSTVAFKLHELENPAKQSRSKDEDKQKLAEILRREEYQKPEPKQESAVSRWFREFLEWLDSLFPKPKPTAAGGQGMETLAFVLQIVFYVALIGLLLFLVVKLAPRLFPKLKRQRKPRKKNRVILGEQIAEDETANDILSEAERLARAGDLRGAIRKGYIALLCELSDRKVIGLSRHKTNRDYLRDVRSRRDLHPRMKTVTDTFERHWYGSQESVEQDWTRFRSEYNETVRSV